MKTPIFYPHLMLKIMLALPLVLFFACKPASEKLPAPVDLQTELQTNPLGIDRANPLFSWKMTQTRRGEAQSAYQVLVASSEDIIKKGQGDIWDSGKVDSDQSDYVKFSGAALKSKTTYYWKVKIWDEQGVETEFSEPATFEMGMMNPDDWQSTWIEKDSGENPSRSTMMRKEFELEAKPVKARLYVTGLGTYVFYVNGKKVGKDILTPGWTDYPKRIQYQVYDITDLLDKGKNAAGAMLGNAWWSGGLGWGKNPEDRARYSKGPMKLLAQLEIQMSDGSTEVVGTDSSWKWHDSPVISNSLYDGVYYDARLEQSGWEKAGFDDDKWQQAKTTKDITAKLVRQQAPPIRVTEELKPVKITKLDNGHYVFDFGQNMVGWGKLKVKGDAGTKVELKYAELLHDDGSVAQENLRSAKGTDTYILKGEGEETWEPQFTYSGFRYVEVVGYPGEPSKDALTGEVFHTDAPWIGDFECSNEMINKINHLIIWGEKGNMMSVPTDCPQRDERLGWMGDAQMFAPTAFYNMDLTRFYQKWMKDITDSQDSSGYVYDVNPAIVVGEPAKPGWGDAVVVVPWVTYKFSGDKRILEDNYDGMKAWVEFMRSKARNNLYIWSNPDSTFFGYGDWIAPVKSPAKPVGVSYYYYSTKLLSKIAGIIGNTSDARQYASLANDIAKAYQAKYYDPGKENYEGETQSANILPLEFGITPEDLRSRIAKNIAEDVQAHDDHVTTGFLGTGYILNLLSENGYHDLAYKLMTQTTYPSWGYMVDHGATTMWELWNSDTEPPDRMNSRNHYALGGIGEWCYGFIGGLRPDIDHPGWKKSIIAPMPVGDLTSARASVLTHYGKLSDSWKLENGTFTMDVVVPPNTSALIEFPKLKFEQPAITLDGKGIFENGAASKEVEGVKFVSEDDSKIMFEVASGEYSFILK